MIKLYFDGGAKPNPGQGYGSYQIVTEDGQSSHGEWAGDPHVKLTSNQAEYLALLHALLRFKQVHPSTFQPVSIYSDSKLVVMQVSGQWKPKHKHMKELHQRVMEVLSIIGAWTIQWNPREVNVEKFGH